MKMKQFSFQIVAVLYYYQCYKRRENNYKVFEYKWLSHKEANVPQPLVKLVKVKYGPSVLIRQRDNSHLSHRLHTLGSLGFSDSLRPISSPESSSKAELCKAGMVLKGAEH